MEKYSPQALGDLSDEMRGWIVNMISQAKSGHPGGSLSAIDLLTALFFNEMRGDIPQIPDPASINALSLATPDAEYARRDHFVLSKGHAVPALYAVLCKKGLIPFEELATLRQTNARLQGHPDRVRIPCVEASTGSLGQGLSVAQGIAMGLKMQKSESRVFCLIGDGEMQEGQIWEAALSAPKFKLSNLCLILDYNNGQIDGPVHDVMPIEPIEDKWKAFGWNVQCIDGHNMQAICQALSTARQAQQSGDDRPSFILAKTVKGKGVSFMENNIGWHGVAPTADEAAKACEEIMNTRKQNAQRSGVTRG